MSRRLNVQGARCMVHGNGVFITGTDTGVGKTYVSCQLAGILRKLKVDTGVFKPFATGSRADVFKLLKAAGIKDLVCDVNPVFFKNSLAPMAAAKLENKKINLVLVKKQFDAMKKNHNFMIIEGAGGVMVPVSKNIFICDLIKEFKLPVILVARPGLGTINHTLLTLEKLKKEKINVLGVVLSGKKRSGLAEKTNPSVLKELVNIPIIELPYGKKMNLEQLKCLKVIK